MEVIIDLWIFQYFGQYTYSQRVEKFNISHMYVWAWRLLARLSIKTGNWEKQLFQRLKEIAYQLFSSSLIIMLYLICFIRTRNVKTTHWRVACGSCSRWQLDFCAPRRFSKITLRTYQIISMCVFSYMMASRVIVTENNEWILQSRCPTHKVSEEDLSRWC